MASAVRPNAPAKFNEINPNDPVILLLAKLQNSPNPVILLLAKNLNSPNPVIRDYDYLLGLHTHLSIGINFSHSTPPLPKHPSLPRAGAPRQYHLHRHPRLLSIIISLLSNVAKDGSLGGFLDLDLQQ